MRNQKTIEVNGKKLLIHEFTQREIRDLLFGFSGQEVTPLEIFSTAVSKALGITFEEYLDFTPSEVEEIVSSLKEVNKSFLRIPDWLRSCGLGDQWDQFVQSIKKEFQKLAVLPAAAQPQAEPMKKTA